MNEGRKILAANWKMNTTVEDGIALLKEYIAVINSQRELYWDEVVVCPPFTHLWKLNSLLKEHGEERLSLGAQNCHQERAGAYTGEVSAEMLVSCGCRYVIIGHSERREYFAEDEFLLRRKVERALEAGLRVIFCCGENLWQRQHNQAEHTVRRQLVASLFTLESDDFRRVVVAYEPVWAIGTGVSASPEDIYHMHRFIREVIGERYGTEIAHTATLLYGGSVNEENYRDIFAVEGVDGALVGSASLSGSVFGQMIRYVP